MDNIVNNANKVFSELTEIFYKNSKDKGFWEDSNAVEMTIRQLRDGTTVLSDGKDMVNLIEKEDCIRDAFISQKLALIASEAGEAINAHRKNGFTNRIDLNRWTTDKDLDPAFFESNIKDNVEDELADVMIRIFDFCGKHDINIYKHIFAKHKYNVQREKKHGAKY